MKVTPRPRTEHPNSEPPRLRRRVDGSIQPVIDRVDAIRDSRVTRVPPMEPERHDVTAVAHSHLRAVKENPKAGPQVVAVRVVAVRRILASSPDSRMNVRLDIRSSACASVGSQQPDAQIGRLRPP